MTTAITSLAQFIYIIWPFILIGALVYSFQGILINENGRRRRGGKLRYLGQNMRINLLVCWTALFLVWIVTLFADQPNLSIAPEPWNSIVFLGGYALLMLSQAGRLGWFERRLNAHLDFHRTQAIQDLKEMDPYAFEALITETYRTLGYRVKHVGHSGDHGVDIEVYPPNGEHWVVQCKRYHDSVGESVVRDLFGTMVSERAARGVLVTTADITPPAEAWARGKPIDLVDGPALLDLIAQARERSEGSLFDRLAHGIDHLLHPNGVTPPGLAPRRPSAHPQAVHNQGSAPNGGHAGHPGGAGATLPVHTATHSGHQPAPSAPTAHPQAPAADPIQQTQPVRARARVYRAPDSSETVPLELPQPVTGHNGAGHNGHSRGLNGSASASSAASNVAAAAAVTHLSPAHTHPHAPICPACGAPMVLRPPRPTDRPGRLFYRCSNYPNCRAVLEKE